MHYRLSAAKTSCLIRRMSVFILLFSAASVNAECHLAKSIKVNLTLPDIALSSTSGPGSILSQKTVSLIEETDKQPFICDGNGQLTAFPRLMRKNGQGIYATGVRGIGYRLYLDAHPFPWRSNLHCSGFLCHLPWPVTPKLTFELVQTSSELQVEDTIKPGVYGIIRPDSGNKLVLIALQHAVRVHRESCLVENKTVDFGNVNIPDKAKAGTVLGIRQFALSYTCPFQEHLAMRWEGMSDKNGYLQSPVMIKNNIAISLQQKNGINMPINKSVKIVPQNGNFIFQAKLLSTGTPHPGAFNTTANLHILYP